MPPTCHGAPRIMALGYAARVLDFSSAAPRRRRARRRKLLQAQRLRSANFGHRGPVTKSMERWLACRNRHAQVWKKFSAELPSRYASQACGEADDQGHASSPEPPSSPPSHLRPPGHHIRQLAQGQIADHSLPEPLPQTLTRSSVVEVDRTSTIIS